MQVADFNPAEDRIVLNGITEADLADGLVRMTTVEGPGGEVLVYLGNPDNQLMVLNNPGSLTPESFPQGFDHEGVTVNLTSGDDAYSLGPISGGANLGDWEDLLVDEVRGGGGDDWIDAGDGSGYLGGLTLGGDVGDDRIIGGAGSDLIDGGVGNDWIRDADNGTLFDGADTPLAGGNDTIIGGDGDDSISSGGGHDLVSGGDGNDLLSDDFVTQDAGQGNTVTLADGAATLDGGAGNDTLTVNDGDVATLGSGADELLVSIDTAIQPDAAAVTVTDFQSGEDRIYLHYYAPEGTALPTLRTWEAADGSGLNIGFEGSDDPVAVLHGVTQLAEGDLGLTLVDPGTRLPS